ncbi:MAG: hypothetical protein CSA79_01620 [Thiothrix nivea]|nr:MAG: hypothetical protein CSA79_01620 [Thiothrix nivea]
MTAQFGNGKYLLILLIVLGLPFLAPPIQAGGISWDRLGASEKTILAPYKQHWNQYSTLKQKKLQRWARQPAAKRKLIKKRFRQWSGLSSVRKSKIKIQLKRYKRMSPRKRLKLKAWWRWVKRLPGHEQEKLKRRLPGMSQQQKKEYIRQLEKKYGRR